MILVISCRPAKPYQGGRFLFDSRFTPQNGFTSAPEPQSKNVTAFNISAGGAPAFDASRKDPSAGARSPSARYRLLLMRALP